MRRFAIADVAGADEDEVAAALAAVALLLGEGQEPPAAAQPAAAWRDAALLEAQGLTAGRSPRATWATAERGARATRWSRGIVGS